MKLNKVSTCWVLALVFAVIAAVFLTDLPTYLKIKKGDIVNLEEVGAFELKKGDVVEGKADYVLGCCAEEYSTTFGIRSSDDSTKLYYVLWLNNDNFIVYCTANKGEYTTLDKITEETIAYLESTEVYDASGDIEDLVVPSTTLNIQGTVSNLPSDIEGYFREWYSESVDDDFDDYCEPVMITHTNFNGIGTGLIVGIVLAVAAVFCVVLAIVFHRAKKREENFGY